MRFSLARHLGSLSLWTAGWLAVFTLPLACNRTGKASELMLLPPQPSLVGPEGRVQLLLEEFDQGTAVAQHSDGVVWSSSDPTVAAVESGQVRARGNGTTVVTASVGDRGASVEITVRDFDQPFTWSFRQHVESVLTKQGCNSGACHGALAGKNGFHLSLRGYDPAGDYLILTRQYRGRRIQLDDPGRSLLLTKPTGLIAHGGGIRLDPAGDDYRVLAEWIASGAPGPSSNDAAIERLEVLPAMSLLRPGMKQDLLVLAHYADGQTEDVTRWVKFTTANESVAQVSDRGQVNVVGAGEAAVTIWFASRVAVATVVVPFEHAVDPALFSAFQPRNLIDTRVLEKLQRLNLPPSSAANDHEFIRRVYLDTLGILPIPEEVKQFVTDSAPEKRERLIEALFERPEFVDYWTYKWAELLLVNSETLQPQAMWAYYNWIRNNVAANTPWDVMARQLVTATGNTLENGANNFFVLHADPLDLAETTTVALLGMSINCARCHNHPLEKWTNDQYYAMANLYARVRTKSLGSEAERVVFAATDGDVIQPLTGRPQKPTPLDGQALPLSDPLDRRVHLANWLTAPENSYFSRAIVNRVWANFMGVGLVELVDDMRKTNPASNEPLLNDLAGYLVEQKFDLRALMRLILQSQTYQRTSQPLDGNRADTRFYSRYYPRRLMAEVLLDSISQVTEVPTEFSNYPAGWRAMQLPDSKVDSYFLRAFGRADRSITCECERTVEPSMTQVLHISNGDVVNKKLSTPGNRLAKQIEQNLSTDQIITDLFLAALARIPTNEELNQLSLEVQSTPESDRRQALEDLYWSILSSKEFLFNH